MLTGCESEKIEVARELARPAKIVTVGNLFSQTKREIPGEVEASDKAELAFSKFVKFCIYVIALFLLVACAGNQLVKKNISRDSCLIIQN